MSKNKVIDAALLRQLAVDGSVDPRTLRRLIEGKTVRGMARLRGEAVLRRAGLLNEPSLSQTEEKEKRRHG